MRNFMLFCGGVICGGVLFTLIGVYAQTEETVKEIIPYEFPFAIEYSKKPKLTSFTSQDFKYRVLTPYDDFLIESYFPDKSLSGCIDTFPDQSIVCGSFRITPHYQ